MIFSNCYHIDWYSCSRQRRQPTAGGGGGGRRRVQQHGLTTHRFRCYEASSTLRMVTLLFFLLLLQSIVTTTLAENTGTAAVLVASTNDDSSSTSTSSSSNASVEGCWQSLMLANYDMDTWLDEIEFQTFVPLYYDALVIASSFASASASSTSTTSISSSTVRQQVDNNTCLFDPMVSTITTNPKRLNIILDATFKSLSCICNKRNMNTNECCIVLHEDGILSEGANDGAVVGGVFLDLSGFLFVDPSSATVPSSATAGGLTSLSTFCTLMRNAIQNACPLLSVPPPPPPSTEISTTIPTSTPTTFSLPTLSPATKIPTSTTTTLDPSISSPSFLPTTGTITIATPMPTTFDTVEDQESEEDIDDLDTAGRKGDDGGKEMNIAGIVAVTVLMVLVVIACFTALPCIIRRVRKYKEHRAYEHSSFKSYVSDRSWSVAQNHLQGEYNSNSFSHDPVQQQPQGKQHRKALRKPSLSSPLATQHDEYQPGQQLQHDDEESSSSSSASPSDPAQIDFSKTQTKNHKKQLYGKLGSDGDGSGSDGDHRPPSDHRRHKSPAKAIIKKAATPFRRRFSGNNGYDKLKTPAIITKGTEDEQENDKTDTRQDHSDHDEEEEDVDVDVESSVYETVSYDDTDDDYNEGRKIKNAATTRTARSMESISESSSGNTTTTDINDLDDHTNDQETHDTQTTNDATRESHGIRSKTSGKSASLTSKNIHKRSIVVNDADSHTTSSDSIHMARSFGPMMMFPPTQQAQEKPIPQADPPLVEPPSGYPGPFPPPPLPPMPPPFGYPLPPMMMPPAILEEYYRNMAVPFQMPPPPGIPSMQDHPHNISIPSPKSTQPRKSASSMGDAANASTDMANTPDETSQQATNSSRSRGTTASEITGSSASDGRGERTVPSSTGNMLHVVDDDESSTPHMLSWSSPKSPFDKVNDGASGESRSLPPYPSPPLPPPPFPWPMFHPFMYMPPPLPPPFPPHDHSHADDPSVATNGFMGYPYPMLPPFMYPPPQFRPPHEVESSKEDPMEHSHQEGESESNTQPSQFQSFHHPGMYYPYMFPPPVPHGFDPRLRTARGAVVDGEGKDQIAETKQNDQLPLGSAHRPARVSEHESNPFDGATYQQQHWSQMYQSFFPADVNGKVDRNRAIADSNQHMSPMPTLEHHDGFVNRLHTIHGSHYYTDSHDSSPVTSSTYGRGPYGRSGIGGRGWGTSPSSAGTSFDPESESMDDSARNFNRGMANSTGTSAHSRTGTSSSSPGAIESQSPYQPSPALHTSAVAAFPADFPVPFHGNETDDPQSQALLSHDNSMEDATDLYTLPEESASVSMSTEHSRSMDLRQLADLNRLSEFVTVTEEP